MADRLHRVLQVNGPLVTAHLPGTPTGEQVRLGTLNLTGEIIAREGERAIVQVYENTESLRPGDPAHFAVTERQRLASHRHQRCAVLEKTRPYAVLVELD